jgi:hypothetical protein
MPGFDLPTALSLINTVVVVGGITTGLGQLRRARHAAELSTLTKLSQMYDEEIMREARAFVRNDLAKLIDEPSFQAELQTFPPGPRAVRINTLGNFFEDMAVYVYTGAISERTVMLLYSAVIQQVWSQTRAAIAIMRVGVGEDIYCMFEHLAMRAVTWQARAQTGELRKLLHDPALAAPRPPAERGTAEAAP